MKYYKFYDFYGHPVYYRVNRHQTYDHWCTSKRVWESGCGSRWPLHHSCKTIEVTLLEILVVLGVEATEHRGHH